jgi:hypothetical protein
MLRIEHDTFLAYGIRARDGEWMFTRNKRDRDHFWENTQRYDSTRDEFEKIDRIFTQEEWAARQSTVAQQKVAA